MRAALTRKNGMKILVVTGSSGGHIFPAVSFLETLKHSYKDIDASLILPKKSITNKIKIPCQKINYLCVSTVRLSLDFKNVLAIGNFFLGCLESAFILIKFRPDIVVGFGSLICVPPVILARILGMKTMIHEQNVIPGRANSLLAGFADKIAVSFIQTQGYFKRHRQKIVFTGNLLRRDLARIDRAKAAAFFGFHPDKFTVLVMGGSLGSHRINVEFLKALSSLAEKQKLQVIHLAGLADYESLRCGYKDSAAGVRLFSFLRPMHYAYSAADLVICRAGATTLAEIMFFGLPAVIIPYPYAYRHQMANAKALETDGLAVVIPEEELSSQALKQQIEDFMRRQQQDKPVYSGSNQIPGNASDIFTQAVLSLN